MFGSFRVWIAVPRTMPRPTTPPPPLNTYRKRTPSEEAAAHVRTRAATLRQKYPASAGSGCFHVYARRTEEIVGISQSTRLAIIRCEAKIIFDPMAGIFLREASCLVARCVLLESGSERVRKNIAIRGRIGRRELEGFLTFVSFRIRIVQHQRTSKCHYVYRHLCSFFGFYKILQFLILNYYSRTGRLRNSF